MKNKKYIILYLFLVITTISYAQPTFEEEVEDVASIPGLFLALAAAIGIGILKFRNKE
ncbi:MAG: hypothetical protein ABF274_10070 [Nonlabens sp.]|uniref:hypothetical protein n=1 Tax=Nonlabens sp. TaxID=1888209 RepID=UPI003219E349